jgi:hypothetical protein
MGKNKALKDIMGIKVSRGFLANCSGEPGKRGKRNLKEAPYEELVKQVPEAGHVHVDETGWKESSRLRLVFTVSEKGSCTNFP